MKTQAWLVGVYLMGITAFWARAEEAPVFVQQPANISVLDGRPATFSTIVTGTPPPVLQWFKDDTVIFDATNSTLSLPQAYPADEGTYWLVASNSFGTTNSAVVELTVIPDTNAPVLVSAVAQKDLSIILLTFSETVQMEAAGTITNYSLWRSGSPAELLSILSAERLSGTKVRLKTTNRISRVNYTLSVSGIRDISSSSNLIASDTVVELSHLVDLIAIDAATQWRFFQEGMLPATNWMVPDFDDSPWATGPGLFYAGSFSSMMPELVRTPLALVNSAGTESIITHYFRTVFEIPGPVVQGSLQLRHVVDDGAIFYLNGQEVASKNMFTRPVNYDSRSTTSVFFARYDPPVPLPGLYVDEQKLVSGRNVLSAELHQWISNGSDATFGATLEATISHFQPQTELDLPGTVSEGSGLLTNAGRITLSEPLAGDVLLHLSSSHPESVAVPETVLLPGGTTNVSFDLIVEEDVRLTGPYLVDISLSGEEVSSSMGTVLWADNETNSLALASSTNVVEGYTPIEVELRLLLPPDVPVEVKLASSDTNVLVVPMSIQVPAGATSAVFLATVQDDLLINGNRKAVLSAEFGNWTSASAEIQRVDNEAAALALALPPAVMEGLGVLTNAGTVSMGGLLETNLLISLSSSESSSLDVPVSVTIPAGESNVLFDLTALNNTAINGERQVGIIASANGFVTTTNSVELFDGPARIQFSPVPPLIEVGQTVWVQLTALRENGSVQTNFNYSVNLVAEGLEGILPLSPTNTGDFYKGVKWFSFQVTMPGRAVQLRSFDYSGISTPFTVFSNSYTILEHPLADLAWDPVSQKLFATVPPTGGVYSNRLVVIDPVSASVLDNYPLGYDPGLIAISPNGQYLYATLSNRNALVRFNLNTGTPGLPIATGSSLGSSHWVRDLAVLAGTPDSVVITISDSAGNSRGVWRYDNGAPTQLSQWSSLDPYTIEASVVNQTLYGYQGNNQLPLMRGQATGSGTVTVTNGLFNGNGMLLRNGVLYSHKGRAVEADTFDLIGDYPGATASIIETALPDVDPALDRVLFLSGRSGYDQKLKAYDRDSLLPLGEIAVPAMSGTPFRFYRWSTNGVVFGTTGGQIWFVESEVLQPTTGPANLQLTQSLTPEQTVIGTDTTISLTITNLGPGTATTVQSSNSLPANAVLVDTIASVGSTSQTNASVQWIIPSLAAGGSATLTLTIRPQTGGWLTNRAVVHSFEADPVFSDNVSELAFYLRPPVDTTGAFELALASEDLLYDPVRDRLLLSIAEGFAGQNNGIAVFNPYEGIIESFTPLGSPPARLARSRDGQFLYVSLKQDVRIRRLLLPTLSQDIEFTLGGESWNGIPQPYYAGDIEVFPGEPHSVAVLQIRAPTEVSDERARGIAVFDDGVIRSNSVSLNGGICSLEFDADTQELYAYVGGTGGWGYAIRDLSRCVIDAQGVAFAETFPRLASNVGNELEYSSGRFLMTGGVSLRTQPFGVTRIYPGSESSILIEPEAGTERVFSLVSTNGSHQLHAHRLDDAHPLGHEEIPGVAGVASSLIRWGTNGLAFRTSSNQLFLVRTPLVQPSAEADLKVAIQGPTAPIASGSNAWFTVVLTNQGPAVSHDLILTNGFTSKAAITTFSCDLGACLTNDTGLIWSLPSLSAGAVASLTFSVQFAQTGAVTIISSAQAGTIDTLPQNNVALAVLLVEPSPAVDLHHVVMHLPARDLIWSSTLQRLLLTASTNLPNGDGVLLSLDPENLALQREPALGTGAGRLKLAEDESRLYAALSYGVEERLFPSLSLQRRFLLGSLGNLERAGDMEVLPGLPESLAVLRIENSRADLLVADNGIVRSNVAASHSDNFGEVLEVGLDPSRLYVQNFGSGGFHRFDVDVQGVTLVDAKNTLLPTGTPMEIDWGGGSIYASVGRVIDPEARMIIATIPGIPSGSLVLYEDSAARVFFLCPEPDGASLRAYDGVTLLPAGTEMIPGVGGALNTFVRWGTNGFAFTTSGNHLALIHSALVPTHPPADIGVSLVHGSAPHTAGSDLAATLVITNRGPNDAVDVAWTNTVPAGSTVLSATASTGSVHAGSNGVSGQLPLLAAGQAATVMVRFQCPIAGVVTNHVSVLSSSVDPVFDNNLATALLWIQPPEGLPAISALDLPVKDLVRDPTRPLLYASFGSTTGPLANSIVEIDPGNGTLGRPVLVGSDPGRMAASPDGQFLYVGLDGAGTVQKLALPDLEHVGSFAVPQNQSVANIVVSPVDPNIVLIRRGLPYRTALFVDGVQRPTELANEDLFAFSETTGELFGCRGFFSDSQLYRVDTGPTGLRLREGQAGKQSQTIDLKSDGGFLFYNRGMVVNPDTTRIQAVMPVPANSLVEPDVSSGRVFYLTPKGAFWTLRAFDLAQGVEVGSVPVPGLQGTPTRLLRWGEDGLALCTSSNQIRIFRGLLVPTNPPVDLVLQQMPFPPAVSTNDKVNVPLQLWNKDAGPISGIVVTQRFSLPVGEVSLSPGTGTAKFSNGEVVWQIDELTEDVMGALNVEARPLQTGTLTVSATAHHSGNDRFWGNNVAMNAVSVTNEPAATNILEISLSSRGLVYHPVMNRLLATTPASNGLSGNLIAVIDPESGAMNDSIAAGSEPNRLAVSDDGQYLYVALDGEMSARRFDPYTGAAQPSFSLGPADLYYAQDLEVRPGHPREVVVSLGSFNRTSGYPSIVALFDDGELLPSTGGPSRNLTFADDGYHVFGIVSPGSSYAFVKMQVGDAGIPHTQSLPGFSSTIGELRFHNGRLYSTTGQVAEPYVGVPLDSFAAAGPLTIDAEASRIHYLTQSGADWQLRTFDLATHQVLATQVVANVKGLPSHLLGCGDDRLAFRTSSNQLFIVRNTLGQPAPTGLANLAVSQQASQNFNAAVETLEFTVSVTNQGPVAASNVVLAIKPPSPVTALTVQSEVGSYTNVNGNFLCNLGGIPAGAQTQLTLSAVITNTMIYSNFVSVSSSTQDPGLTDNRSMAETQGLFYQRGESTVRVPLAARDLAFDPVDRRLYASVSETNLHGHIAWLDPETGFIEGALELPGQPDQMAMSDDHQYLYVTSLNTGMVHRIHLPTRTLNFSFNLPADYAAQDIQVLPGQAHAVAVTASIYGSAYTAIFDEGVARPVQAANRFRLLTFSDDGMHLFGYDISSTGGASPDVFRMAVDASGMSLMDTGPSDTPWGQNVDWEYHQGLLYFGNGDVLNPSGWTVETPFPRQAYGQWIEINETAGLTIYMIPGSPTRIAMYDLQTRQEELLTTLSGLSGGASLVQCGADRLAFRTGDSIILYRSDTIPAADLRITGATSASSIYADEPISMTITVSNSGSRAVTSAWLTNALPDQTIILSANLSQGALETNSNHLVATLGTIAAGGSAELTMMLQPTNSETATLTNVAVVCSFDHPDPVLANNRRTDVFLVVADADRDGLPDDWELAHGLNTTNALDASLDSDCDGWSNIEEYLNGTHPMVFDNARITDARFNSENHFQLFARAAMGQSYILEVSTNLLQWMAVGEFVHRGDDVPIVDPSSALSSAQFYRLIATTNTPMPIVHLSDPHASPSYTVILVWAPPGYHYSLQSSTNLLDWQLLTNYFGTECFTSLIDTNGISAGQKFYRVRLEL